MTPEQARQRFAKIVERDGKEMVAARLGCSVTQVIYIVQGKRDPGMRISCAIEEIYEIAMHEWVERPAAKRIAQGR